MKTAISIPDELFNKVDELASELHLSRSQVFTDAEDRKRGQATFLRPVLIGSPRATRYR